MEVIKYNLSSEDIDALKAVAEQSGLPPINLPALALLLDSAQRVVASTERNRCRLAAHDAIMRALDEAGVYNDVLRGICAVAAMERFEDELGR